MFYSPELLTKRDSGFGLLWLAATLGSKSTLKKLTKKSVMTADISHLCNMIAQPSEPLALRLSSNLMIGVTRVYKLKHEIFVNDVTTVYSSLKKVGDLGLQRVVDPASLQMRKSTTTEDKITLTREEHAFYDLGLDEVAWDWDIPNDLGSITHSHSQSKSPAANRSLHTIDESHLQSLSVDMDGGDPFDDLDLGNVFGDGSVPIDLGLDELGWDLPQTPPPHGNMEVDNSVEFANAAEDYAMDAFIDMEPLILGTPQAPVEAQTKEIQMEALQDAMKRFDVDANNGTENLGGLKPPKSILAASTPVRNTLNLSKSPRSVERVEFHPLENNSLDSSTQEGIEIGVIQTAPVTAKPKRGKKQVRVLLDPRIELSDAELKAARDNYLQEQARLRHELEQQKLQKEVVDKVKELLYGPPDILEAEPLRQLWPSALMAQVETKTGSITVVKAPPKRRTAKRRRLNDSDDEGGQKSVQDGVNEDEEMRMDIDGVGGYDGDYLGEDANINDDIGTTGMENRRSSEEPEMLRAAPSRAGSINSIEYLRAGSINSIEYPRIQDDVDFEMLHSGLLPWDNAAPSSSANGPVAASIGSGAGRRSAELDTNIELRSLSGSRRASISSSQRPGSPAIPASIEEVHIDEFRFSVGEGEDEIVETQRSEATWDKLERNSNNFLAFLKIQQNLRGDASLSLDDMIGQAKTVHVAANAFHCVLDKLAPSIGGFFSRLGKSSSKSGQADGEMGQANSKKPSKKGSKDAADPEGSPTNNTAPLDGASDTQGPSTSNGHGRATGNGNASGSTLSRAPTKYVARGSAEKPASSNGNSSTAPLAVPQPQSGSAASPSTSPNPGSSSLPRQPAPLDIPTTQTILSTSTNSGLTPSTAIADASSKTSPRTLDIDDMIQRLLDVGYSGKVSKSVCLKNTEITSLCLAAREVFLSQPTLIELSPPVKIVGDVHGQYSDLIRLFEMCGFPPAANYLFLGDYVDRGKQSLETILLLLCYKVKFPENFFLLRGNHECANVTRVYGFYDECKRRCTIKIWKTFIDVFNCLPIASIVASKIFCVHGGLSPNLQNMEDIKRIARPTDVPDYGLLNDLLWSDPSETAVDWEDNERGVSYCFGKSVINDFLAKWDMDLVCRAHMVVEDGYEFWNDRTLVTIFSAPNYCGEFDNYGACMSVSEDLLCAFELLKPLDPAVVKKELNKAKRKSQQAQAALGSTPSST